MNRETITMSRLRSSKLLAEAVEKGSLRIVGAYYHLGTGAVDLLTT